MKKLLTIPVFLFVFSSCQNESITRTDDISPNALASIKNIDEQAISFTSYTVVAESNKISRLNVVYPSLYDQNGYYGVTFGYTRLILDIQADGNLIKSKWKCSWLEGSLDK